MYGVNPQSSDSHTRYAAKLDLPFGLIPDKGGRVARVFRAGWGPLVRRTVYVIDPDGRVAFAQRGAPPVADILKVLR